MRSVVAGVAALLIMTSCGGTRRDEIVISAAASLGDVFAAFEVEFEEFNPDIDVVLNLGGSSTLREQILAGAPVDVFAPASLTVMDDVVAEGVVAGEVSVFATNELVIAVPAGNPGGVSGLADLGRPELLVGLCSAEVPCGALAAQVLDAAGVVAAPDTFEPDVRALRTKLALGELDVGLVYATDVLGDDSLRSIEIEQQGLSTRYPIAVISRSGDRASARRFVDFVLSSAAAARLKTAGFGTP